MPAMLVLTAVVVAAAIAHAAEEPHDGAHARQWLDPAKTVDQRVELLLAQMTTAEKVNQLLHVSVECF